MKIHTKLSLGAILLSTITNCYATSFLTEDQIVEAQSLASQSILFEEYRDQQKSDTEKNSKTWFTLAEFEFDYKGEKKILCMAHGTYGGNWSQIAVYAGDVDPTKIKYSASGFSDLGQAAPYLSTLKHEFVPAQEGSHPAYFILEKVNAGYKTEGKGYSQASVQYFVEEFVTKRTGVNYVFSDLRNEACYHYFPKYGFQAGIVEEFKDIKFKRPIRYPYNWVKK